MPEIWLRDDHETTASAVTATHPLPVKVMPITVRRAVGKQYGLTVSTSVVRLTVPKNATAGEMYVRTASVVFTRAGGDPTATQGFQADPGDLILLNSRDELLQFETIRQGGADATMDVEFFSTAREE